MNELIKQIIGVKAIKYLSFVLIGILVLLSIVVGIEVIEQEDNSRNNDPTAFKPAIYLYPEITTQVKVDLFLIGEITVSDPLYDNGWDVIAYPNGTIETSVGNFEYLFYEARLDDLILPQEGWCIDYYSLETWMIEILDELGLKENESAEFKEYWLESLPYMPYYEIKLVSQEYLEEFMELRILPLPDTTIRVFLNFEGLNSQSSIRNPIIIKPNRNGFTAIEWGGFYQQN